MGKFTCTNGDNEIMESITSKIQYDAWLHWNVTYRCPLDCAYCFFHGNRHHNESVENGKCSGGDGIDIPSLIETLDTSKMTFTISFTGGEPFCVPNLTEACVKISEHHYISLVTNLITGNIKEFAEKLDPRRVADITASLHLGELERRHLLDSFIDNYVFLQAKKFSIVATQVAYPPLLPDLAKYRCYFEKCGLNVTFEPFTGSYQGKHYPEAYSPEELHSFRIDNSKLDTFKSKGLSCNAGYNVGVVSPTGSISPCFQIHERLGSLYGKIKFKDTLTTCHHDVCRCPLYAYDPYLFKKALGTMTGSSYY